MCLGHIVLQLFCASYIRYMFLPMLIVLHFYTSTSRSTCAVPNVAVFCGSLMWFPGICSGIFWMVLWLLLLLLLLLRNFYHTRVNFIYLRIFGRNLKETRLSHPSDYIGSRRICRTGFVRCKPVGINYLTMKCYIRVFSYNVLLIITVTTRDFWQPACCLRK